jgi:hypothetical protein
MTVVSIRYSLLALRLGAESRLYQDETGTGFSTINATKTPNYFDLPDRLIFGSLGNLKRLLGVLIVFTLNTGVNGRFGFLAIV